jgi:hypothetical protein
MANQELIHLSAEEAVSYLAGKTRFKAKVDRHLSACRECSRKIKVLSKMDFSKLLEAALLDPAREFPPKRGCPGDQEIALTLSGGLEQSRITDNLAHIGGCLHCMQTLAFMLEGEAELAQADLRQVESDRAYAEVFLGGIPTSPASMKGKISEVVAEWILSLRQATALINAAPAYATRGPRRDARFLEKHLHIGDAVGEAVLSAVKGGQLRITFSFLKAAGAKTVAPVEGVLIKTGAQERKTDASGHAAFEIEAGRTRLGILISYAGQILRRTFIIK